MFLDRCRENKLKEILISSWILFFILADVAFTCYWIYLYGYGIEFNPIGKVLVESPAGIVLKIIFSITLLNLIDTYQPNFSLAKRFIFVNYLILTIYHIVLFIYHQLIIVGLV